MANFAQYRSTRWIKPLVVSLPLVTLVAAGTRPTPTLDKVESAYTANLLSIEKEHDKAIAAAKTERAKGLSILLNNAMDAHDLDAAMTLRDKIKDAKDLAGKGPVTPPPATLPTPVDEAAELTKRLNDTTWEWGGFDDSIRFRSAGKVTNADWDSRGLVTSWKAIDRRTVLLYVEIGRTNDRYAILCFDSAVDCYSVFGFGSAENPLPQKWIKKD